MSKKLDLLNFSKLEIAKIRPLWSPGKMLMFVVFYLRNDFSIQSVPFSPNIHNCEEVVESLGESNPTSYCAPSVISTTTQFICPVEQPVILVRIRWGCANSRRFPSIFFSFRRLSTKGFLHSNAKILQLAALRRFGQFSVGYPGAVLKRCVDQAHCLIRNPLFKPQPLPLFWEILSLCKLSITRSCLRSVIEDHVSKALLCRLFMIFLDFFPVFLLLSLFTFFSLIAPPIDLLVYKSPV